MTKEAELENRNFKERSGKKKSSKTGNFCKSWEKRRLSRSNGSHERKT